jgi:flagellar hook-length control protein FliK
METQPTQPSLMQISTNLGLATDNSLPPLDAQNPDGRGFSSLLSGYLPNKEPLPSETINDELLSQQAADEASIDVLNSTALAAEGLPLLGQALPLEVNTLNNSSNIIGLSTEKDTSLQVLEEQGFYAQSLVSSVMGNDSAARSLNNTPSIGTGSAKSIQVIPQQVGLTGELKMATSGQTLTASELDEAMNVSSDRFLGAEQALSPLRSKNSTAPELRPAPVRMATVSPSVSENTVSLALTMNVDPAGQSLNELIDGEDLEQGEFDAELKNLERKQDDQTLKLTKGQQAWGDALTERITMNAAQDIKQVTIHLDPPELGSLELKLQINDDKQAQVQVQVQSPQVKEALESSAHRLRDMLASEGLELSGFDVQSDSGRGQQSSENTDGQAQSQDSDASQNSSESISLEMPKPKNNNLLDTFV